VSNDDEWEIWRDVATGGVAYFEDFLEKMRKHEKNISSNICLLLEFQIINTKLHGQMTANKSLGSMARFISLGTKMRNQNYIHEEFKNRLETKYWIDACYKSVHNLLSPISLAKF
jgi:hypothetical protein